MNLGSAFGRMTICRQRSPPATGLVILLPQHYSMLLYCDALMVFQVLGNGERLYRVEGRDRGSIPKICGPLSLVKRLGFKRSQLGSSTPTQYGSSIATMALPLRYSHLTGPAPGDALVLCLSIPSHPP